MLERIGIWLHKLFSVKRYNFLQHGSCYFQALKANSISNSLVGNLNKLQVLILFLVLLHYIFPF